MKFLTSNVSQNYVSKNLLIKHTLAAGEMAPSGKCLPPSLDPQRPCKKLGIVALCLLAQSWGGRHRRSFLASWVQWTAPSQKISWEGQGSVNWLSRCRHLLLSLRTWDPWGGHTWRNETANLQKLFSELHRHDVVWYITPCTNPHKSANKTNKVETN